MDVRITQCDLYQIADIQEQVHRSINIAADGNTIHRTSRLVEEHQGKLTGALLRSNGINLAGVSIHPDFASNIEGGWQQLRFGFTLCAVTDSGDGSQHISYVNGWTDRMDMDHNNNISPETVFSVNSVLTIFRTFSQGIAQDRMHSSFNLLFDPVGNDYALMDANGKKLIRPVDILGGIKRNAIDINMIPVGTLTDAYGRNPMPSSTDNSIGTDAIANVLNSVHSSSMRHDSVTVEDALINAQAITAEVATFTLPFFAALSSVSQDMNISRFSWGDLTDIYPPVANTEGHNIFTTINRPMDASDNAEVTVAATIAYATAEALSSLMLKRFIGVAELVIGNSSLDGSINLVRGAITTRLSGLDPTLIEQSIITPFLYEVETKLFTYLSNTDMMTLELNIRCDLNGYTSIDVGVNGMPPIPFVFPTLTNSLASGSVTTAENQTEVIHAIGEFVSQT